MYQYSYADIMEDAVADARGREREALDRAAALLRQAASGAPGGPEELRAISFTTALWGSLIHDLAQPGNALPDPLRASLMSIGLGVMAECQRVSRGESRDLAELAEVCGAIRDGLN